MNIDVAWNHYLVSGQDSNDIRRKKFIHQHFGSSYLFDEGLIKIEDALKLNGGSGRVRSTKDSEHWPIKITGTLSHSQQRPPCVILTLGTRLRSLGVISEWRMNLKSTESHSNSAVSPALSPEWSDGFCCLLTNGTAGTQRWARPLLFLMMFLIQRVIVLARHCALSVESVWIRVI